MIPFSKDSFYQAFVINFNIYLYFGSTVHRHLRHPFCLLIMTGFAPCPLLHRLFSVYRLNLLMERIRLLSLPRLRKYHSLIVFKLVEIVIEVSACIFVHF